MFTASNFFVITWLLSVVKIYKKLHWWLSMPYTRKFELNTIGVGLVENALRGELNKAQSPKEGCHDNLQQSTRDKAAALLDLLGSLHNQKSWYRPKNRTYISG